MPITHTLKTLPEYWLAVQQGRKTFELRKNDRGFAVGNLLRLVYFEPGDEKGEQGGLVIEMEITYVLHGPLFGLEEGYAILGIKEKKIGS
jgi:hypothetical protein